MSACYNCGATLNRSNRSAEHIIPNAIGGVIKSYRLLCRRCNMTYGATLDAALVAELEPITTSHNITRDRRKRPDGTHSPYLQPSTPASQQELAMRALARIAVNYYLMKERGVHHLSRIINVVSGVAPNDGDISHSPPTIDMAHDGKVAHLILIRGDAALSQLHAHVVLFNTYSFYVMLCSTYSGNNIEHTYHYDIDA